MSKHATSPAANAYGLEMSPQRIEHLKKVKDIYQLRGKGKRSFTRDRMNIATGQARLFGSESKDAEKDNNVQRRGKRILGLPQAKREGNIV